MKFFVSKFLFLFVFLFLLSSHRGFSFDLSLPPAQEDPAYKQYQKQSQSELAKINYLFNRFSRAPLEVLYDSYDYKMPEAIKMAKSYLYQHYHKEKAEYWIKNYCYRSDGGQVIL